MKIDINDEQAYVIVEALDLFSRVLIGQAEEVGGMMNKYSVNMLDSEVVGDVGKQYTQHNQTRRRMMSITTLRMLSSLKHSVLGIHANGSYGIHSDAAIMLVLHTTFSKS